MELLAKAKDPAFWQDVREKECFKPYREMLFSAWDTFGDTMPIPPLRYQDFRLFEITGNRSIYEKPSLERRRGLSCAAMLALIYPEEEKYLLRLMDMIFAISTEYTWAFPAHIMHIKEDERTRIELFAAETGFYLAEIYTLLYDRFDARIRTLIEDELERRIFAPYRSVDTYYWENCTNNWAAVCLGSVASSFMLIKPLEAKTLIPRFEKTMKNFLSGFTDDGVCLEGHGYWNYGFGYFLIYADFIRKFTDGEIDHFKNEKVKRIALGYEEFYLNGKSAVTFSDGSDAFCYVEGRMHYLKGEYPDEIHLFDKSLITRDFSKFGSLLRDAICFSEEYDKENAEPKNKDFFAPLSEWLVSHREAYAFAAKGGHNDEPHNHNDVGSFIYAKDGKHILTDLGHGLYTRQYFSDERYSILEASSRGHSVPIVDGGYQLPGAEHRTRYARFEDGTFKVDIASAYALDEDEKIERSFTLEDTGVTLKDRFELKNKSITERLVTLYQPTPKEDGVILIENARLHYDAALWEYSLSTEKKTTAGEEICYLLDFTPKGETTEFVLKVE